MPLVGCVIRNRAPLTHWRRKTNWMTLPENACQLCDWSCLTAPRHRRANMNDATAGATATEDRWAAGDACELDMGRWSRVMAETFLGWLAPSPHGHWLEVGCGTGALTASICALADPASVTACTTFGRRPPRSTESRRFDAWQPAFLTALFTASGSTDVECTALTIPTMFASFDDYWEPFLGC